MPNFQFFQSTRRADILLAMIKNELYHEDIPDVSICVFPYHNGRECGWDLRLNAATIKFSESKRSDDLVVYTDGLDEENVWGDYNCPSEKSYKDAHFFTKYEEACAFCVECLLKAAKKREHLAEKAE